MAKFRKKPVVIEAVQLTWQTWSEVCDFIGPFPDGMRGVYVDEAGNASDTFDTPERDHIGLIIPTLEGDHLAREEDFIIRGIQGELYPIKDSIFHETYEPVE